MPFAPNTIALRSLGGSPSPRYPSGRKLQRKPSARQTPSPSLSSIPAPASAPALSAAAATSAFPRIAAITVTAPAHSAPFQSCNPSRIPPPRALLTLTGQPEVRIRRAYRRCANGHCAAKGRSLLPWLRGTSSESLHRFKEHALLIISGPPVPIKNRAEPTEQSPPESDFPRPPPS